MTRRGQLAEQLLTAELKLRQAQTAVQDGELGAGERYAKAMEAMDVLNRAVEVELMVVPGAGNRGSGRA